VVTLKSASASIEPFGTTTGDTDWVVAAIQRTETALLAATAPADRIALIRSLARLLGGRLDLQARDIGLSEAESDLLDRFGLALTNESKAIRLVNEEDLPTLAGLPAALGFESRPRQIYEPASPDAVLLRLTNHGRYRTATQKAAVRALLTQPPGSGLMVSMPTGSGKSLLFQIAAAFERKTLPGACAIVITPTIALALDHARTLSGLPGLERSRALVGDMPPSEAQAILNGFRRGEVPILLLSPEKALAPATQAYLMEAAAPHPVEYGLEARLTHMFVDEAHIIETWGRSFRPDFQRLPALLARLRGINPDLRAVLLSATLSDTSRRILRDSWRFDGAWLEVDARTPRFEHDVVIGQFGRDRQRQPVLDHVIDRAPRPLIVYTTKIDDAATLCARLRTELGYGRVALFTGDTGAHERKQIVEGWAEDEYDIVVATSAFGMGIDKADVRSIVHACLPEGPARWYQEIGRASRDGGQGLAACLFTSGGDDDDVRQAYGLATSGWLSRELAEERWLGLLKAASDHRWEGARRIMSLNLDAFREGLRPKAGDWNRGWNMTLITLMQRAGVLQVLSVAAEGDQSEFVWDVEVRDPRLMEGVADEIWNRISAVRDAEIGEVRAGLDVFVDAMRHPEKACITRTAFELIEPNSYAPPCGRCPACRAMGIAPPARLSSAGLEKVWQTSGLARTALPAEILLMTPADPHFERGFSKLIETLTAVGVEQIVVPQTLAHAAAQLMAGTSARLGLVMDMREWSGDAKLAHLPSAVLLPEENWIAETMLDRVASFGREATVPLLVAGRPERLVRGRRLDQTVSRHAPYSEAMLREVAADPRALA
jgi:ATP-dependent DNA helicase RecQ